MKKLRLASDELISFDEEVEAEPTQAIAEEDIPVNPNYKKDLLKGLVGN